MAQVWNDLLFAHWPIPPDVLRSLVPLQLPLDVHEGNCWVGVVPFWMSGVRPRGLPPIPGLSTLPELNVRTYVTVEGKPGVYFFSLDAGSRLAVWGARNFFHLPYFLARMSAKTNGEWIEYHSQRVDRSANFTGRYRPIRPVFNARPGTLEHFLVERYCLYTVWSGKVYRCNIHHPPWSLQTAEADFANISVAQAAGISLPQSVPLLHFAKRQDVIVWPLHATTGH